MPLTNQEEDKAAIKQRKLRENIAKRYPDQIPENDDWSELEDRYSDDMEQEIGKYKEGEMTMQELVSVYPELGMILNDMVVNKLPFRAAIVKYLSHDELIANEGDEDYEAYQSAYEARKKSLEDKANKDKEIEANEVATMEVIDRLCERKKYDDEEKSKYIDFVNSFFTSLLHKKLTDEEADALDNARNYNKDVVAARDMGKIEGRNENIELKKAKTPASDGVPSIGTSAGVVAEKKSNPFFEGVGKKDWTRK